MFLIKRYCNTYNKIATINTLNSIGNQTTVKGWIQNIRRLKKNIFLDVNDGTTWKKFQVIVPRNDATKDITPGTSIRAKGIIQSAPNGGYELYAEDIQIIADGNITEGYPFTPKQMHAPEYVREHLHLRSRVDYIASQMRLRHKTQKYIHDYMDEMGFIQVHTPILTTNDCEGAGEVFKVQPDSEELLRDMSRPNIPLDESYFDSKVFLSVSGQLHLEAMSYGLGNVYNFMPAFRAENCKSPLHLSEFYMFEAELAFLDTLSELTLFIENMLKNITTSVVDKCSNDLNYCQKHAVGTEFELTWLNKKFTTLCYDEASKIILNNKNKFKTEIKLKEGFSKEQEIFLVNHCDTPVFVIDWPASQKAFYMRQSDQHTDKVHALDLLMPNVGELCGGSLREINAERLQNHPRFPKGLEWYLDLRRYGGIPTGGFGMGFERYLQLLTGVKNIRDVIPYPRYPHNCTM